MLSIRRRISTLTLLAALPVVGLLCLPKALHAQATGLTESDPLVFSPAAISSRNQILSKGKFIYPEELKGKQVQGSVGVDVLVGPDGHVRHVSLLYGSPLLTNAAMMAGRETTFRPLIYNGKAVFFRTQLQFQAIDSH